MRRGTALRGLICALLAMAAFTVHADMLLMVRSPQPFPEAMNTLQQVIAQHGYVVKHVQRVDIGLTASGYQTEEYRVVFFGKADEIRAMADRYPQLVPYLPLKIVVFAERDTTLLVTHSPELLKGLFAESELHPVFDRWQRDVRSILDTAANP